MVRYYWRSTLVCSKPGSRGASSAHTHRAHREGVVASVKYLGLDQPVTSSYAANRRPYARTARQFPEEGRLD